MVFVETIVAGPIEHGKFRKTKNLL